MTTLMTTVFYWSGMFALCAYALSLLFSTLQMMRGPTPQDRVLALDAMYVCGMLMLLALGILLATDLYFDIAVLMSMFGFVSSAVLAKFLLYGEVIQP